MTGQEAIAYLEHDQWSASKPGLERTFALLEKMGNPQSNLKFIHVAGSNGKGSLCAMLERILRAAGLRCGLYTSPYIQDFTERMQINGVNIAPERLGEITESVRSFADTMAEHPTQFELITAVAFQYFYEENTDIVVLETGLGGRLDSTNVIDRPEVACITNIGMEHTDFLGDTLEKIAYEKAGIIKKGCTCVCYDGAAEVTSVVRKTCEEKQVPFIKVDFDRLHGLSADLSGQRIRWKGQDYDLPLLGKHQLKNAAMALTVIEVLRDRGWSVSEEAVAEGLKQVQWPARMEVLSRHPLFILDGGHNPQCAAALTESLDQLLPDQQFVFLCGFLADKDYHRIIDMVLPYGAAFVCVTPDSPRALPADQLAALLSEKGADALACGDASAAMALAMEKGKEKGLGVIAFGSLYMAGSIRTLCMS